MKVLLLTLFILTSCASSASREWGPWIDQDIEMSERRWDICHEEKYGPDLHLKGFCWSLDECRERKTIIRTTKKECRVKIVSCKWGDIPCMQKYHIDKGQLIINF